jgi:hypothetical protein
VLARIHRLQHSVADVSENELHPDEIQTAINDVIEPLRTIEAALEPTKDSTQIHSEDNSNPPS